MHLIQILLPILESNRELIPMELHTTVKAELTEKFGGITAHVRSPAEGRWRNADTEVRDEIVIYEVMASELDETWWHDYRTALEARFHQGEVIIRAWPVSQL